MSCFAKASSDRALLRTASGKPLQTRGAAAAKERSPKDANTRNTPVYLLHTHLCKPLKPVISQTIN